MTFEIKQWTTDFKNNKTSVDVVVFEDISGGVKRGVFYNLTLDGQWESITPEFENTVSLLLSDIT